MVVGAEQRRGEEGGIAMDASVLENLLWGVSWWQ